jgi:hypothetical protein
MLSKNAIVSFSGSRMPAWLDVQRILAHDVRLEHERHALVARVTGLAEAVQALVGVDPDG